MEKEPIFKPIFGKVWDDMPIVMLNHYANRARTDDVSTCKGTMDVWCNKWGQPFLWLMRSVPAFREKNIPATVDFISEPNSAALWFCRRFQRAKHNPYFFNSRMVQIKDNIVAERMACRLCWHSKFAWDGKRVTLSHAGYSVAIFDYYIPLPITWLIGSGDAYEEPIDDETFDMCATLKHPLWGLLYEYKGRFKMVSKHE